MTRLTHLDIPFFDDLHREQAAALDVWCAQHLHHVDHADTDAACRRLVTLLGEGGHLRWCDRAGCCAWAVVPTGFPATPSSGMPAWPFWRSRCRGCT